MTIHDTHPFADPPERRDPLRRFRGRTPAPVSVWAHGTGRDRAGLTVSSFLVADGDPARVLGLVDEDAAFWDDEPTAFAVSLLSRGQGPVADVFAGLTPSPGGTFTTGTWHDTDWGPVLDGAAGWLGVRRVPDPPRHAGWALLVEGVVEHVDLPDDLADDLNDGLNDGDRDALLHVRGRYR